ncbi:hypothetical protein RZS08_52515, partial [Arthrospira platensis SPKY1]|nr:hypothetical protein [Arthrospira platensis SPKY1]
VTDQPPLPQVQGHAGVAMPARAQPAALVTEQDRSETTPVEEQQHLFVPGQVEAHALQQGSRQALGHRLAAHVENVDNRFGAAAAPFRQPQQPVAFALGIVAALQRRSGRT